MDRAAVRRVRGGRGDHERFHYLIDEGQTGLSTAFDMSTLMGIDSNYLMSDGEVGKEGVAIDTLWEIQDSAYEYQQRVEPGEDTEVGVTDSTIEEVTSANLAQVDKSVGERQCERLSKDKAECDAEVEAALRTSTTPSRMEKT